MSCLCWPYSADLLPAVNRWYVALLMATLFASLGTGAVRAQSIYDWYAGGSGSALGGTGTWDLTSSRWVLEPGTTFSKWPALSKSKDGIASFAGTSGTVTLAAAISAGGMIFKTDGYTINPGSGSLALVDNTAGFPPIVSVVNAGQTATINARLTGSVGLTVDGAGTLNLGGGGTFTGGLDIAGATVRELTAGGTLASSNSLGFYSQNSGQESGTFILDNTGAAGATAQTFSGLYAYGEVAVETNRVAAQNLTLTFASSARGTGATVNYIVNGGVNGTQNQIILSLSTRSAGFVDQGTFFNGSSYAWADASNGYVRGINYGVDAGSATTGATASVASVAYLQITGSVSAQQTATFTTVKIAGANDFSLADGNTVTVNGILKADSGAATTGLSTISGGTLVAGSQDMVVRTDQAGDALTISSTIADNGNTAFVKTGAGTLFLTNAANAYAGSTYLNAGTLSVATLPTDTGGSASVLGTGGLIFAGGTLAYTGANSVTLARTITPTSGGGTINVSQAGAILTLNQSIAGTNLGLPGDALVKSGPGTLVIAGSDDNSGLDLAVNGGTLTLAKASSSNAHAATNLTVSTGGTALLSGTGGDQLYNGGAVTLSGGTLAVGGVAEGSRSAAGTGALTLAANSTLDFTRTSGGLFSAGSFTDTGNAYVLSIINYLGDQNGNNATQLIFGKNMSAYLGDFQFQTNAGGYVSAMELQIGTSSFYEIVPTSSLAAVPEPATWLGGALLGLLGFGAWNTGKSHRSPQNQGIGKRGRNTAFQPSDKPQSTSPSSHAIHAQMSRAS